ncbi:twin arginine-targeting protein translocase, TatA/E family [Thiovulum sp. ES]|nr:twin arginine-targeting protein translocase, TatA/E family [Thiovulum sp. ES]
MGLPGGMEWLIILGIVVILFGGRKIPDLMKGIGTGIKNFKQAVKEDEKPEIAETEKKTEIKPETKTV